MYFYTNLVKIHLLNIYMLGTVLRHLKVKSLCTEAVYVSVIDM